MLEKLAAGQLRELQRDGKKIVWLSRPADVELRRAADGQYALRVLADPSVQVHVEQAELERSMKT